MLVAGAGIAGLTHAYWLAKAGFHVVVIERSAALRDEGYMMDFSAEGIQVARAMGILERLYQVSANLTEIEFVGPGGKSHGGFRIGTLQELMTRQDPESGYIPLMRGDLERTLAGILPDSVELRMETTIAGVLDRGERVDVTFTGGSVKSFDLLVIAEGIHSATRSLVFGPEENFLHPLNSIVAIARFPGGIAGLTKTAKTNINVGSFVITTPTTDGDVIGVFAFTSTDDAPRDQARAKSLLRAQFPDSNTFAQRVLAALSDETELFIDRVAQIRNPRWSNRRVALIGDAASCMTLLSGQGSTMAMAQAYVLAHELATCEGDYATAFANYERALRTDIEEKMRVAAKVSVLIPESTFQLAIFKLVTRFMRFRPVLRLLFGAYLKPTIFNKGYPLPLGV